MTDYGPMGGSMFHTRVLRLRGESVTDLEPVREALDSSADHAETGNRIYPDRTIVQCSCTVVLRCPELCGVSAV